MSLFDIKRSSPHRNVNLKSPTAAAALRGVAFQESATAGTAELADGLKPFSGFVTRDVTVAGPVLGDSVYPGRLELPFKAGDEASFEQADEVELEGTDYILLSGTGLISSGTALESDLSFSGGKLAVKQSGQGVFFRLKEIMTPEVSGNLRIRIERANF